MYDSPIRLIAGDFSSQFNEEVEDQVVYKLRQNYDIIVNKEELKKALAYNHDQYNKGYRDGIKAAYKNVIGVFNMAIGADTVEELEARLEEFYRGED